MRSVRVVFGWLCAGVACVGVLVLFALPLRLAQSLAALVVTVVERAPRAVDPTLFASSYHAVLAPLERFVVAYPWLWPLLGGLSLLGAVRASPLQASAVNHTWDIRRWQTLALALLFGAALLAGARLRLAPLLEREGAVAWRVDYDEGVYVSFARMWSQGNMPYRDMWVSHPPTGIALFVPVAAFSPTGEDALANSRRMNALLDMATGVLLVWVGW